MSKDKIRGFEVVSKYKNDNINLPYRATEFSAGYDFESAETIIIPSMWHQVGGFLDSVSIDGSIDYDIVERYIDDQLNDKKLKQVIKELGLRPTLISTGIKSYMQSDEYLQLSNRSSGALNKGLIMSNSVGIIDAR